MKTCAFFGSRTMKCTDNAALEKAIRYVIEHEGATHFWFSGDGSFDATAEGTVLRLQSEYPQIKRVLVYPYATNRKSPREAYYDDALIPIWLERQRWYPAMQALYKWMGARCDMGIVDVSSVRGPGFEGYRVMVENGVPYIIL